jgi:hypothetical protein
MEFMLFLTLEEEGKLIHTDMMEINLRDNEFTQGFLSYIVHSENTDRNGMKQVGC